MITFCPFFKDECKGNQCVMWSNEKCLIVDFLQKLQSSFEKEIPEEEIVVREPIISRFERPEPTIPEEIKQATPETLAAEFILFLETEFPESKLTPYGGNFELFLQTKNLTEHWNLPPEIRLKIKKAQTLARDEIQKRIETEHKIRFEREKEELPSLVDRCADWAITKGMKRVTVADVDAFILENEFDILKETRRALYSMTNVKLKSKK